VAGIVSALPGLLEALELADLGASADGGERVDPAQASQPRDCPLPWRAGDQLGDRLPIRQDWI
jgi:hypothetical protein